MLLAAEAGPQCRPVHRVRGHRPAGVRPRRMDRPQL